jgi:hypothetical protein
MNYNAEISAAAQAYVLMRKRVKIFDSIFGDIRSLFSPLPVLLLDWSHQMHL